MKWIKHLEGEVHGCIRGESRRSTGNRGKVTWNNFNLCSRAFRTPGRGWTLRKCLLQVSASINRDKGKLRGSLCLWKSVLRVLKWVMMSWTCVCLGSSVWLPVHLCPPVTDAAANWVSLEHTRVVFTARWAALTLVPEGSPIPFVFKLDLN